MQPLRHTIFSCWYLFLVQECRGHELEWLDWSGYVQVLPCVLVEIAYLLFSMRMSNFFGTMYEAVYVWVMPGPLVYTIIAECHCSTTVATVAVLIFVKN